MSALAGIAPATSAERTKNPLRPEKLDDIVGQTAAKLLMARAVDSCYERRSALPHTLLVGAAGTGKSTFSHAIANELCVDVFELEAPVSLDTLLELRLTMQHGDILKIEEIHQQGIMERRGRSSATQPEVLYAVMEDRVLPTATGVLEYPQITVLGTTTDEGLLPDAFIDRFPLRPRLEPYTHAQLVEMAMRNGRVLDVRLTRPAAEVFAKASRGVPRQVNNLLRNVLVLTRPGETCTVKRAREALLVNGISEDGLTPDMQMMLTFLYTCGRQERGDGEVTYQASVDSIATAIGKSRDSKAVKLRVEPYLIEKGYVQVATRGRKLTDRGIDRAKELLGQ